jgi:hypothetical protein
VPGEIAFERLNSVPESFVVSEKFSEGKILSAINTGRYHNEKTPVTMCWAFPH